MLYSKSNINLIIMEDLKVSCLENLSSICRLCLQHVKVQEFNPELFEFYRKFAEICEDQNTVLPCNICEECKSYLEDVFRFREKCKCNEATLLEQFPVHIKEEPSDAKDVVGEPVQEFVDVKDECEELDIEEHELPELKEEVLEGAPLPNFKEYELVKKGLLDTGEYHALQLKRKRERCRRWKALQQRHDKKYEFTCDDCGEQFLLDWRLNRHRVQYHKASNVIQGRFKCKECGKGFKRVAALKTHYLLHTIAPRTSR